jgi:hypothetical protein
MEVDLLAKSIIEECEVVCPKVKCPWKVRIIWSLGDVQGLG